MDVGGYPINLSYQSGAGIEEEASWVGTGWSLNPGAVNRSMRGIPDDFNGDEVKKTFHTKPMKVGCIQCESHTFLAGKREKPRLNWEYIKIIIMVSVLP